MSKPKVMVVDDDPKVVDLVQQMLRRLAAVKGARN